MPSFQQNIEERRAKWANVSRTYTALETAYNDLYGMIDSMKSGLKNEALKSDEFLGVKHSFESLQESYQNLNNSAVEIDNIDDWDALQEFFDKYNKAREAHEQAMTAFLEE